MQGNSYAICIHFTNKDGESKRGVFSINVDEYTALSMAGVYSQLDTTTDAYLYLQTQNDNNTPNKTLFYRAPSKVAQLYSFVLYVQNGQLQRIEDDNSPFCNGDCKDCIQYSGNN